MLFTHGGKVYALSPESVVKECYSTILLDYDDLLKLVGSADGFCAETFLNGQVHGKSIAQNHVLVVNTKVGMVWCSNLSVHVPAEVRKQFGIVDSSVGREFAWPWNPGRATLAWLRFADAEKNDGHYRTLAHLSPKRRDMSVALAPEVVEGCVEVPWAELTDSQRFFLSHLNPTTSTLCMSTNPGWDAGYVADAKRCIAKRRRMQSHESRAPLYMTVADGDLVASEQLTEADSDPVRFFDMRKRGCLRHESQNMFPYQRVTFADWAKLPEEVTNVILESIATDAFQSSWQDYQAAQGVADLRLVCRGFRDSLDASLGRMWTENSEFSRRVLKGSLAPPPAVIPSLGLASVVSVARRADTWRKLAALRKVGGVQRKRRMSFAFHGNVPKRLTFGEANRDDIQELLRLNKRARVQCDTFFF